MIAALLEFDNELIDFNEVIALIVKLLFVIDASSQEDSDDTVLIFVGGNINVDIELLGIKATGAANNINLVHVVVKSFQAVPVVGLMANFVLFLHLLLSLVVVLSVAETTLISVVLSSDHFIGFAGTGAGA